MHPFPRIQISTHLESLHLTCSLYAIPFTRTQIHCSYQPCSLTECVSIPFIASKSTAHDIFADAQTVCPPLLAPKSTAHIVLAGSQVVTVRPSFSSHPNPLLMLSLLIPSLCVFPFPHQNPLLTSSLLTSSLCVYPFLSSQSTAHIVLADSQLVRPSFSSH